MKTIIHIQKLTDDLKCTYVEYEFTTGKKAVRKSSYGTSIFADGETTKEQAVAEIKRALQEAQE